MVTFNMVVFWLTVLMLFWISSRDEQRVPADGVPRKADTSPPVWEAQP